MPRRRSAVPAPLKRAARDFEKWRKSRTKRHIPDELWNLAIELAARFGVHRCARTLRLDYVNLKRRFESTTRPAADPAPAEPTFVEVVPAESHAESVLELESERGAKLKIRLRGAGVREVAALASSLWRAEP